MNGDAELDAMGAVKDALEGLESDARERVVGWAIQRFDIAVGAAGKGSKSPKVDDSDEDDDQEVDGDGPEGMQFDHFAELFARAQPTSDAEKALVAGYWIQEVEGKAEWGAQPVNAALKNLGHSLSHISRAMSTNMKQKPQLIIQLRKAGNTQQAKKTYKVTEAGKAAVKNMLANGGT